MGKPEPSAVAESVTPGIGGQDYDPFLPVPPENPRVWERLPSILPGPSTGHWEFLGVRRGTPFRPFPAQWEVFQNVRIPWPGICPDGRPYPLIWGLNCGRRFSKTTIGERLMWTGLLSPDDFFGPPAVRLTADTDEHAQKIWRNFIWTIENTKLGALVKDHSKEYNLVTFHTGATAQMLSAHNPQTLSGDGVTLWIVDEAQFFSQAAFDNMLPSTAERSGVIVMLGVSEGDGPFREVCYKGDSPDFPEFQRLTYPTAANPFVPKWVLQFHARNLTPTKYRQLYLAQWVGELGRIFRNIEGCILDRPYVEHPLGFHYLRDLPPRPGHVYYGGLDLARLSDWSVLPIFDRDNNLVAWDRFSLVDWELQKVRIGQMSAAFGHPPIVVDSTGVGDSIYQDMLKMGLNVQEYKITSNDRKRTLIDELAIRIGSSAFSYPNIPVLLEELRRMEAKHSSVPGSNVIRYEAPNGLHDDFVLACALACQGMPRRPVQIIRQTLDPYAHLRRDPRTGLIIPSDDLDNGRRRGAEEYIA